MIILQQTPQEGSSYPVALRPQDIVEVSQKGNNCWVKYSLPHGEARSMLVEGTVGDIVAQIEEAS